MTPKQFYYALEDWKNDQLMIRTQMFYGLDPILMQNIRKPSDLLRFPWEKPDYIPVETDWSAWDQLYKN